MAKSRRQKSTKESKKSRSALSSHDLKLLWSLAGSKCSRCDLDLIATFDETGEKVVVGEHAHIKPHSPDGPRGIPGVCIEHSIDKAGPASYENSILLCGACHTIIDGAPEYHSIDVVRELKASHERRVRRRREQERAGYNVRIVIKEDLRQVGSFMAVVGRSTSFEELDCVLSGKPFRPSPRVKGIKPGPPQSLIDVILQNLGAISLQIVDFQLAVDKANFTLDGAHIIHNDLKKEFSSSLEPLRSKRVELKANRLAKLLRDEGVTEPVSLTFSFIDEVDEIFSREFVDFDPRLYDDIPDSVAFEEW